LLHDAAICSRPPRLPALFDASDAPARQRLMRVLDSLNARYGRDTVTYAASGRRRAWKLRSDQLSARYTTDWDELLSIR
jgi:DNA polymerase V